MHDLSDRYIRLMSLGESRRLKDLAYRLNLLKFDMRVHVERVNGFVPNKSGDSIVVDFTRDTTMMVMFYLVGRIWHARYIALDKSGGISDERELDPADDEDALVMWAVETLLMVTETAMSTIESSRASAPDEWPDERWQSWMMPLLNRKAYLMAAVFGLPSSNL